MRKLISMCVAVFLIFLFYTSVAAAQEGGPGSIGLSDLKGQLEANKGKVVLLNFWSPF